MQNQIYEERLGLPQLQVNAVSVTAKRIEIHCESKFKACHRSGALIIESAFTSVPDVAARHYPFLPVRALARSRFANLDRIAAVTTPLLVILSRHDEIIPFEHGQRLFEAAPSDKIFLELEGATTTASSSRRRATGTPSMRSSATTSGDDGV